MHVSSRFVHLVARLLAVLMVAAGVAAIHTVAASPALAGESVDAFVNQWNGKFAKFDNVYGAQCVDLFDFYNRDVAGAPSRGFGNAYTIYDDASASYYSKHLAGSGYTPVKGDVAIWASNKPYSGGAGHVAIVLGVVNSSTINVLSQNRGYNDGPPTPGLTYDKDVNPTETINMSTSYLRGYLHPLNLASGGGGSTPPAPPSAVSPGGTIVNQASNRCVDVSGVGTANGTNAVLWDCYAGPGQTWQLGTDGRVRVYGNYNKCLDADGGGAGNGRRVQIWDCNGGLQQQWVRDINGWIHWKGDGRCIDASGAGTQNGTPLVLWDCYGGANQKWYGAGVPMPAVGNGGSTISGKQSGKCIDVSGVSTYNGTDVLIWDCYSGAGQQWRLTDDHLSVFGNFDKCLDADGNGSGNGRRVQIWDCNGSIQQEWVRYADGSLRWKGDGRCLDATAGAVGNGTKLILWDCSGGENQIWSGSSIPIPSRRAGSFPIIGNASGRCIDVAGVGAGNGIGTLLWDCYNGAGQGWLADGNQLRVFGNYNKCLDADASSSGNGRKVQAQECNGGPQQQWAKYPDGTIRWLGDGRCVDALAKSNANGTVLVLWDCYDGSNQKWHGVPIEKRSSPVISGDAVVGSTLTASSGSWGTHAAYSYQWLANGVPIEKATSSAFRPTSAQVGARLTVRVTASNVWYESATNESGPTAAVRESVTGPSSYVPLTPSRVLDTRSGNGASKAPIGAGQTVNLQVTGRGGVPTSGVAAVVLNVTATGASAYGYLIGYPAGISRPDTSILNYYPGKDVANQTVLKVGAGGKVSLYAYAKTNVIADVLGYYPTAGGKFIPLNPARIVDSTAGKGVPKSPVAKQGTVSFKVTGVGGVPANATVVALNVTTFQPAGAGWATVWPAGAARPTASNANYVAGQKVASFVLVKVGAGGMVNYYSSQATNVLVDVLGYGTSASDIKALTPARLLDTRAAGAPVSAGGSVTVKVLGRAGVPAGGVKAVVVNVTAVGPAGTGYLTVFPTGVTRPVASNLNYASGATVANSVIAKVGSGGNLTVFTSRRAHVIVDVLGYISG